MEEWVTKIRTYRGPDPDFMVGVMMSQVIPVYKNHLNKALKRHKPKAKIIM